MQNKRWVGALGNVTQCEEVSGGYRHKFSYRPPGRQLVEHNDVLAQPHERGESLPIEYLESEPKLYRQLGQPANWVEVVGQGWCLALLVGGSACMIFYAWWLHKQT
ncbi:hypothetical protein IV102_33535 [bacterium]|nr:hypothetical protein [bacterium]